MPKFCSPSCRQRAYEARRIKLVYEQSHAGVLRRLNADLDHIKLRTMVYRILADIGLVRPTPSPPRRRKPQLTLVENKSTDEAEE